MSNKILISSDYLKSRIQLALNSDIKKIVVDYSLEKLWFCDENCISLIETFIHKTVNNNSDLKFVFNFHREQFSRIKSFLTLIEAQPIVIEIEYLSEDNVRFEFSEIDIIL